MHFRSSFLTSKNKLINNLTSLKPINYVFSLPVNSTFNRANLVLNDSQRFPDLLLCFKKVAFLNLKFKVDVFSESLRN